MKTRSHVIAGIALAICLTWAGVAIGAPPVLPPVLVDTTYALPTGGTTHTPANSAAFAAALTAAALGDVIVLAAGTTYTGPFVLPDKGRTTSAPRGS